MARTRKELANGAATTPALGPGGATATSSKLPTTVRFPLLVVLNLSLSALLYSFASEFTAGDLSSVSRSINEWWEISSLVGFRILELAIGWWGQFDGYDLAALTCLTHAPPLFLLTFFYSIHPSTLLVSLTIDVLSALLPFRLLRPLSATHTPHAPVRSIANRTVISDLPVQIYISLLGSALYSLSLYFAFSTYLPVHLVIHFDALSSLELAHDPALLPKLLVSFLPLGLAAKVFLFTPATGARSDIADAKAKAFNPETAGLWETVLYNLWGYSKRTRVLVGRTMTLVAITGLNTWLQCYVTVEGAEGWGAAGWAATWSAAALVTGAVFWWVANVNEVRN